MPKIAYVRRSFSTSSQAVIDNANTIIADYRRQGFTLTLRQLYYQFVSKDLIPNQDTEYKRLGSIINDARLAGQIDWNAIEDRGRNRAGGYGADSDPADHVKSIAAWFRLDQWNGQGMRPEVWVEKQALEGVVARTCNALSVPYLACKGYMSQSEMWTAGQRFAEWREEGYEPIVIHLGDHDPSGIDMSRDITDRLALFAGGPVEVRRIALNMDQVRLYNPPPNPAKLTDSRSTDYIANYGRQSWELDALDPATLDQLIRDEIATFHDPDALAEVKVRESAAKLGVSAVSRHWEAILEWLRSDGRLTDHAAALPPRRPEPDDECWTCGDAFVDHNEPNDEEDPDGPLICGIPGCVCVAFLSMEAGAAMEADDAD